MKRIDGSSPRPALQRRQPNAPRRAVLLAPLLAAAGHGRAQNRPPLSVALAPFLSPAALLGMFSRLHRHLQQKLARPVEMVTARDFRSLLEATRRAEHDVVQLPAHLARLAMLDWGWKMLGAPATPVTVIVAVKDQGPVRQAADLKGRPVGMLDALSLTATVGRRWLELQGLADAVSIVPMASINSALFALDRDEVAAFVAADTQLNSLPAATPRGERLLASIGGIPGPLFIASPKMSAPDLAEMRAALESYQPDPALPPNAANAALRPVDEPRLKQLDAYVVIVRRLLASGN